MIMGVTDDALAMTVHIMYPIRLSSTDDGSASHDLKPPIADTCATRPAFASAKSKVHISSLFRLFIPFHCIQANTLLQQVH